MEKPIYKINDFEGPLDLLLFLIKKNKLNILDIPIAELLEQYLEQIKNAQNMQMEISSDFIEMASRLIYIKTVYLLPSSEEGEKLRQQLSGELIEYDECKKVAETLKLRYSPDYFSRNSESFEPDYQYSRKHKPIELVNAYLNMTGKKTIKITPSSKNFSDIVTHKIISVTSQIVFILRNLRNKSSLSYQNLFVKKDKPQKVAAFLAMLELVKGHRISIEGNDDNLIVKLIHKGEKHQ